ncbi:hypothetical protein AVEN_40027-1 [Araneus ventricosus]|uniref:Uncharacterized protein n=1 Tax=Araneus ventricosus TaxID=182803 RepID=A0A4Y2RQC8_ARAVE|nr:hypothetical protein AVEN_40027-1 [Araneus ventricosus]
MQKSDVRFVCPIRAFQSYNSALLEYRMPICLPAQASRPWRGLKNLFHELLAIKFGESFTGPTVPTFNPILGDRVDHRCGPVYYAPSSPCFQNGPTLP